MGPGDEIRHDPGVRAADEQRMRLLASAEFLEEFPVPLEILSLEFQNSLEKLFHRPATTFIFI
jgi:hypothetical protein